ncbi:hypothetical protein FQZ97_1225430 [compost metagenome]
MVAQQALQCEARGVIEDVAGSLTEACRIQVSKFDLFTLEANLLQHGILGWLQETVEAAQDDHRQDDVAILAAHKDVAQAVISDRPDKGNDAVVCCVIHETSVDCPVLPGST